MKKINYIWALSLVMLLSLSTTFVSCGDDDEDNTSQTVDVREQALGSYSVTTTVYVEDEGKLVSFASELAELGEALDMEIKESDFQVTGTATVSKTGDNKLLIKEDGTDPDQWVLNNIREASNGFIFDVETTTVDDVKFTNYNGYHLEGETKSYGGGYIAANKKLEFYIYTTMEELLDAVLDEEDAETLAQLLVAAGYTEEDAEEDAKQKVVFEFTFTKK